MPKTVTVKLSAPIEGHGELVHELTFREPRFEEIAEHGEPFKWHPSASGEPFYVENLEALAAYARQCLDPMTSSTRLALQLLGVEDSRKVVAEVGSFFRVAAAEASGSTA